MSLEYQRLLMYFILVMGVIVIGVLIVSFVELQKANTHINAGNAKLESAYIKLNATQTTLNQTKLFLASQQHEDERQEKVNKMEMIGRSNQTRVLINNTQDLLETHHNGLVVLNQDLKEYIQRYNNTTDKTFKIIEDTMQQNQNIINLLVNVSKNQESIQKQIEANTSNTNIQVSKWGPENNALGKAILEKMGLNATKILQEDVYGNQTLKNMIIP